MVSTITAVRELAAMGVVAQLSDAHPVRGRTGQHARKGRPRLRLPGERRAGLDMARPSAAPPRRADLPPSRGRRSRALGGHRCHRPHHGRRCGHRRPSHAPRRRRGIDAPVVVAADGATSGARPGSRPGLPGSEGLGFALRVTGTTSMGSRIGSRSSCPSSTRPTVTSCPPMGGSSPPARAPPTLGSGSSPVTHASTTATCSGNSSASSANETPGSAPPARWRAGKAHPCGSTSPPTAAAPPGSCSSATPPAWSAPSPVKASATHSSPANSPPRSSTGTCPAAHEPPRTSPITPSCSTKLRRLLRDRTQGGRPLPPRLARP